MINQEQVDQTRISALRIKTRNLPNREDWNWKERLDSLQAIHNQFYDNLKRQREYEERLRLTGDR